MATAQAPCEKTLYGPRSVARDLNNPLVWLCREFGEPPSKDGVRTVVRRIVVSRAICLCMGFMDTVRAIFGNSAEHDASREADPEDLFGMSTAYMTMEANLGYPNEGAAALCFSSVDSTDFEDTLREVRDILEAGEAETGTSASIEMDQQGYHWVVLEDSDPEDLVTSIHFAADTFIERGYGSRLLAALFAFEKSDGPQGRRGEGGETAGAGGHVYWVYSFRRGAYYPFAPERGRERDQSAEFKLQSVLDGELGVEEDESYWYPLWPESSKKHPWE